MGTVNCSQAFEDCIGIVYHVSGYILLCVRIVSFERLWSLLSIIMSLWCNAMLCAMSLEWTVR